MKVESEPGEVVYRDRAYSGVPSRGYSATMKRAARALLRGLRAVALGDDPRRVARRLRGIDLQGRSRLCRDVAARCLEGAGGCQRPCRGTSTQDGCGDPD